MNRSSVKIRPSDGLELHRKKINISMGGRYAASAGAARTIARALIATGIAAALSAPAYASSHREAPGITKTPKVDGTDFYMFRSYEPGRDGFVTLVANYSPLEDPFGGPNYFTLDEHAIYEIHINNTGSGLADITFQFRFDNVQQNLALSVGGISVPIALVDKGQIGTGGNPNDTANLNVIESYSLSIIRHGISQKIVNADTGADQFIKPVDNIGQETLPEYAAYANAHIYNISIPGCGTGRVFAGQRKDSFVVDLGETFDLINYANPVGEQFANSGRDDLASKNITSLIIEVPISCLTAGDPVIGAWTTASTADLEGENRPDGTFAQQSRLGMGLVNELVIGLKDKDKFNASQPKDDAQFLTYVTNPTFPAIVQLVFSSLGVQAPTLFPRSDLVATFLTGIATINQPAHVKPAEMLRLNTSTPVTPSASQNRLGVIGGDPAGYPNGRRPGDDLVDITLRVAMGRLITIGLFGNPSQAPSGGLDFTDGAIVDASFFDNAFPYLKTPLPGSPGQAEPHEPLPASPLLPGFEPIAGP
jgi:Domain of unknown function (DUF4331)